MGDEPSLDGTDREIVAVLIADARTSLAAIGRKVSLSPPAVKRRIDRLETLGVITGYTTLVDHAKLGRPLEAFAELRFAGNTRVDDIATVAKGIPEVQVVYTTAGDPDALALLRVRDVDDLKRVIDRLRSTDGVVGTKTLMVLGAWSPDR